MTIQTVSNHRGVFDPSHPVSTVLGLALMFSVSHACMTANSKAAANSVADKQHWEHTHRIGRILGMQVLNRQEDKVGEVKDVVLDNHGAIAYVIVSTGRFLGLDDRLHAIPWTALNTQGNKNFIIDIDKATLQKAPGFTSRDWPDFADEQWVSNNHRFYRAWVVTQ